MAFPRFQPVAVVLLAATLAGGALAASTPAPLVPGNPADGRKIFVAKACATCHKADGSGGIKLTGNPTPNWRDAKRMADSTYDDAYLRECIMNGRPKSGMLGWGKTGQLKPQQISHLIAYIRTFSAKK